MDVEALADWTPIALDLTGAQPTIDWCDLSSADFTEPFFDQTVERCLSRSPAPRIIRTDLDALLALDGHPSLEPCGMIFHMSRCGSTLISRLLQTMPDNLVVVEPAPLNSLLEATAVEVDETVRIRVIRLLIRALGRARAGSARRLILKLSSWNIRRAQLLTAAFPGVPTVWVQREPREVLASLAAGPPGWLSSARAIRRIFNLEPASGEDQGPLLAEAVGTLVEAATDLEPDLIIDYRDLPDAVWERLAPLFAIAPDPEQIEAMRAQSRYSAKASTAVPYDPIAASRSTARIDIGTSCIGRLESLYQAMDRRRTGT